jgi:hypothetical protein
MNSKGESKINKLRVGIVKMGFIAGFHFNAFKKIFHGSPTDKFIWIISQYCYKKKY